MNEKNFPYLKKNFLLHLGPRSHVYSLNDQSFYILNKDAAEILVRCNGKNSIEKISIDLANFTKEDYNSVFHSIKSYIYSQEFIDLSKNPVNLSKISGEWNTQTPIHVSLELIYECNFYCKHCYNDSDPGNKNYVDKKEIFKLLDSLRDNGVAIIEFTGGEPFLHPNFFEILEHSLEIFSLVAVITNGYLLEKEILDKVSKYKNKLSFQIGLHSSTSSYMDWFCGKKGAFDNAKRKIKLLTDRDFITRVNIIVTPLNLTQIYNTVQLAIDLGANFVGSIGISNVIPMGRGDSPELLFTSNIESFIKELERIEKRFGNIIFRAPEIMLGEKHCGAGSRSFSITPAGDIKPCVMADEDLISWGNVYNEELNDILSRNICSFFIDLDVPQPQLCGDCEYLTFCNNCLARGFIKHHEIKEKCVWGEKIGLNNSLERLEQNV